MEPSKETKSYTFLYDLVNNVKKADTHGTDNLPTVVAAPAKNIAYKIKPDKKTVVDQHFNWFNSSK